MSVTLRSVQIYEPAHEQAFLELEKQFARLEQSRADLPKGRRLRVVSGGLPAHTLIWECDFADVPSAWVRFNHYCVDAEHVRLAELQRPYLRQSSLEILESF